VTARGVLAGLLTAAAAAGCAATGLDESSSYRGDSGPVNWEIVGIRTNITDGERQIRWNFTVILRETGGRSIQFESIETSAQMRDHPDALMAGSQKEPFRARLAPRGEYRFNTNYGLSFTSATTGGFGQLPGGRQGVIVLYRLTGRDETGQSITVAIPVSLYPGSETQVREPVTSSPPVSPTVGPPPPARSPLSGEATVPESPSPSPALNPARQAAEECAARSTTLKVLGVGEAGDVNFEYAAGEEDEFRTCYESRLQDHLQGRLVEVPGGPLRTSVAIEPMGTSFVVVATINATYRARLLLDTGAAMTVIRPRLAEGIDGLAEVEGLRPTIIVAIGAGVTVRLARLRSFAVGDFEVDGLHVGIYDVVPHLADVDGLLGTDVLHRFTIHVDGDARRLSLERKP
jgi:hypothetical protein